MHKTNNNNCPKHSPILIYHFIYNPRPIKRLLGGIPPPPAIGKKEGILERSWQTCGCPRIFFPKKSIIIPLIKKKDDLRRVYSQLDMFPGDYAIRLVNTSIIFSTDFRFSKPFEISNRANFIPILSVAKPTLSSNNFEYEIDE